MFKENVAEHDGDFSDEYLKSVQILRRTNRSALNLQIHIFRDKRLKKFVLRIEIDACFGLRIWLDVPLEEETECGCYLYQTVFYKVIVLGHVFSELMIYHHPCGAGMRTYRVNVM